MVELVRSNLALDFPLFHASEAAAIPLKIIIIKQENRTMRLATTGWKRGNNYSNKYASECPEFNVPVMLYVSYTARSAEVEPPQTWLKVR